MPDDVKIPITTPGAQAAKRSLEEVARAERGVGADAQRAGKEAAQGKEKAAGWTDRLFGKVKALAGAYLGLRGAQIILNTLRQETEALNEASRKAAESMRAVLALSSLKGEKQELQDLVWKLSVESGTPIEQVAPAYYSLMGGTAGMAPARQQALMQQALLMRKTDPSASLDALVGLFTTMATQQPGLSPQQIGNLMSRTIEQAKATPEEMAQALPSILTTAEVGKVDVGTTAALFSFATRAGGGVAETGTAVRAAMLGLLAPTPETAKELAAHGFPAEGGLMERIQWLAREGEGLPPQLMAALGGRRGMQGIARIAAAPAEFAAEREMMRGALTAPGSLLSERLRSMYGEVPGQRYEDQIKQLDVMIEKEKVKPEKRLETANLKLYELQMRRLGYPEAQIQWNLWWGRRSGEFGMGTVPTGGEAEELMYPLLEEGYPTEFIADEVYPRFKAMREETRGTFERRMSREDVSRFAADIARRTGMQPMGGQVNVYEGGTHYHNDERRDPAARPVEPVNQH